MRTVGFASRLPIRDPASNYPAWDTDHPPEDPGDRRPAHLVVALPGYFDAVGIPLFSGRDFSAQDRLDAPLSMVINRLMAQTLFGDQDPLGRRVSVDLGREQATVFEIVGIVGDVRFSFLGDGPSTTMYLSYYQFPQNALSFAIRTDRSSQSITQAVRTRVLERDRDVPVENLVSMEQLVGDSLASQRVTAATVMVFSLAALLLACMGLAGVLAYSVSQRTHEIAIRMAMGAERHEVLRLVVSYGLRLTLIGLGLGIVGALGLTRFLSGMLVSVRPTDPATFGLVSLLLVVIAPAASLLPARRATKIDPLSALRCE